MNHLYSKEIESIYEMIMIMEVVTMISLNSMLPLRPEPNESSSRLETMWLSFDFINDFFLLKV